jgi:hypothetical protein
MKDRTEWKGRIWKRQICSIRWERKEKGKREWGRANDVRKVREAEGRNSTIAQEDRILWGEEKDMRKKRNEYEEEKEDRIEEENRISKG